MTSMWVEPALDWKYARVDHQNGKPHSHQLTAPLFAESRLQQRLGFKAHYDIKCSELTSIVRSVLVSTANHRYRDIMYLCGEGNISSQHQSFQAFIKLFKTVLYSVQRATNPRMLSYSSRVTKTLWLSFDRQTSCKTRLRSMYPSPSPLLSERSSRSRSMSLAWFCCTPECLRKCIKPWHRVCHSI